MKKSSEKFDILYSSRLKRKDNTTILVAQKAMWNGIVLEIPEENDDSPKAKKTRELLGSSLILNKGLTQFKPAFETIESGKSTSVFLTVEVTYTGEVDAYGVVTNVNLVADQTELYLQDLREESSRNLKKMMSSSLKKVSQFSLSDFLDEEEEEEIVAQIPEPTKAKATATA